MDHACCGPGRLRLPRPTWRRAAGHARRAAVWDAEGAAEPGGRPGHAAPGEWDAKAMTEPTARHRQLKEAFTQARGYWDPAWEDVLSLDADFFEAYLNLSAVPWRKGTLAPKVKEFIYIRSEEHKSELQSRQYLVCR